MKLLKGTCQSWVQKAPGPGTQTGGDMGPWGPKAGWWEATQAPSAFPA